MLPSCRRFPNALLGAWLSLLVVAIATLQLGWSPPEPSRAAAAQQTVQPRAYLTANELPDGVRYTVAINRDPNSALRDVRVDVQLPPGAQLAEAYETPGFTQLLASDGGVLRWVAPSFPPGPFADAFAFLLRQAPQGDFNVTVRWDGDRPGQAQISSNPKPMAGTAAVGEIVLGPEGTFELVPSEDDPNVLVPFANPGGVFVGDTGVLIAVTPNAVPAGTVVRVRKLAPDQEPPAAAGDLWWCAVVEVTGLPPGVEASLFVPARRPLPPSSEVALFTQRDGRWERLERNGRADFSGQYIEMLTRGGVMAAGTAQGVRNQAATTSGGARPTATPIATGAQPARTLPAAPTAVVGALPTATPVGTLFSLQAGTQQTPSGGGADSGGGSGASPPGGSNPDPFIGARLKIGRLLDTGSCNPGAIGSGGEPNICDNGGNGGTSCGTVSCNGTINSRLGTQECNFNRDGSNARCHFSTR